MRPTFLLLLLASVALAADVPVRSPDLPPLSVPGALNPDVTQANIHRTICVANWTKTVRPPSSYTNKIKATQLLPGERPEDFEEDHDIPLVLGGHPRDPRNLWKQHWSEPWGARSKDRLEVALHKATCSGRMTLHDAQECIRVDWVACYKRIIGEAGAMR